MANHSVQDAVYQELKKGIMTLYIAPGTEMSTQEIATKLQVSRTPVREAFIRLQREGLVKASIPQKGTVVSKINLERVGQERFLRESLELGVVAPFLEKAEDLDFGRLRSHIQDQISCYKNKDYAEFVRCDNRFHKTLFDVAGQQLSWEIISNYNGHYNRIRVLTIRNEDTIRGTIDQHMKIVELMEQRNVSLVQAELQNHVQKLLYEKNNLLDHYPEYFTSGEEESGQILIGSL